MYNDDGSMMHYRIDKKNHYIEIDTESLNKEDHISFFNYVCTLGFKEKPREQHIQVFLHCNGSFYVIIPIRSQNDVEIWNDNLSQIKEKYNTLYVNSNTKRKKEQERRNSDREYRTALMNEIQ